MEMKRTGPATDAPSRRWDGPEYDPHGNFWVARLKHPPTPSEMAAGVEPHAFGPDRDACIRETQRLDALWAWLPMRAGNVAAVERRRAYLRGEGDGQC